MLEFLAGLVVGGCLGVFVVAFVTYVVMPQLVRLFRPWLARH